MATKKYESIEVSIPRSTRLRRIVFGAIYSGVGVLISTPAAIGIYQSQPDAITQLVYGIPVLILGVVYLVRSIKRTHEPQLTASAKAAKEADDRAKRMKTSSGEGCYLVGAQVIGGLTFIVSWLYCMAEYGFLLGFGLGWLPSIMLAAILGALWPLVVIALIAIVVAFIR